MPAQSMGTAGTGAAAIAGKGVVGWLRAIYDKLAGPAALIVTGNQSPGDNLATPANAVNVVTYPELYDPVGNNFDRARAVGTGVARTSSDGAPLTYTESVLSIGAASGPVLAAGAGNQGREIILQIPRTLPAGVVQTKGVHIAFGAAATAADVFLSPGAILELNTLQAINGIREATAIANVTGYLYVGTPAP